VKLFEVKT